MFKLVAGKGGNITKKVWWWSIPPVDSLTPKKSLSKTQSATWNDCKMLWTSCSISTSYSKWNRRCQSNTFSKIVVIKHGKQWTISYKRLTAILDYLYIHTLPDAILQIEWFIVRSSDWSVYWIRVASDNLDFTLNYSHNCTVCYSKPIFTLAQVFDTPTHYGTS